MAEKKAPPEPTLRGYLVTTQNIAGRWREGATIGVDELQPEQVQRLLDLNAITPVYEVNDGQA